MARNLFNSWFLDAFVMPRTRQLSSQSERIVDLAENNSSTEINAGENGHE
jgi:hypothetical protein